MMKLLLREDINQTNAFVARLPGNTVVSVRGNTNVA
jgi:hypothetical protein